MAKVPPLRAAAARISRQNSSKPRGTRALSAIHSGVGWRAMSGHLRQLLERLDVADGGRFAGVDRRLAPDVEGELPGALVTRQLRAARQVDDDTARAPAR